MFENVFKRANATAINLTNINLEKSSPKYNSNISHGKDIEVLLKSVRIIFQYYTHFSINFKFIKNRTFLLLLANYLA